MQFQVPQFIDIAPKIIGPLTLRQFLLITAAAFPSFLLFFVLQFWLWIIITGMLVGSSIVLAFGKINGQPIMRIAGAAFGYFWKPRLYLWKNKAEASPRTKEIEKMGKENFSLNNILKGFGKNRAEKTHIFPEDENKTPLGELSLKMNTWSHPIEKREKTTKLFGLMKSREKFEGLKKTTGEREVARRVDYR